MPRTRRPYSAEFRRWLVGLVPGGRSPDLRANRGGVPAPRGGAQLEPPDGRLGHGRPPADRAGAGSPGHGAGAARAPRRHPSNGSRVSVYRHRPRTTVYRVRRPAVDGGQSGSRVTAHRPLSPGVAGPAAYGEPAELPARGSVAPHRRRGLPGQPIPTATPSPSP